MRKGLVFLLMLCFLSIAKAQIPFQKGVNLTGWLQARNVNGIKFQSYSQKDFADIKSLGCDVIRLPINLHGMTLGAPEYTIDPVFLSYLDSAISWAESLNLYLIIDNHSFNPSVSTSPEIEGILLKVWPQLADRYKKRSDFVIYEVLNEPHGIANDIWGKIQGKVIEAIRAKDKRHTIIVGPSGFNSYNDLAQMPIYSDPNLIYTFHFYDPFMFTHQGASWNTPSMVTLANVPFPYVADRMPQCPPALKGSWMEQALKNYPKEGNVEFVKSLIDIAVMFRDKHKVDIFCGEFGVLMDNSIDSERVYWYKITREYLEERSIPWTSWDYRGGFGIFTKGSQEQFPSDLNIPLIKALGLTLPK